MDRRTDRCIHGQTDRQMYTWTDGQTEVHMDRQIAKCTHRQTDRKMYTWTDGQKDVHMVRWTDSLTDILKISAMFLKQ